MQRRYDATPVFSSFLESNNEARPLRSRAASTDAAAPGARG
jgi:hypothetical protein